MKRQKRTTSNKLAFEGVKQYLQNFSKSSENDLELSITEQNYVLNWRNTGKSGDFLGVMGKRISEPIFCKMLQDKHLKHIMTNFDKGPKNYSILYALVLHDLL